MPDSLLFSAFDRFRRLPEAGLGDETPVAEEQSGDYESGRVVIGGELWRIRTARVTPTKPGAFVAVWRRAQDGGTEPFDGADECAGLLVLVEDGELAGIFRFTRADLVRLGITSSPTAPGKRGFRVYPSWCDGLNAQAARTQRTQAAAFTDLSARGAWGDAGTTA